MSLVIRRVKEISKKRNKKPRKWYIIEPFEDTPSKLLIDEEYGEEQDSLPSLNSVYKKTIVGTPILFRRISGWEYQDTDGYNVNFQTITFMKEYHNKSFEELRWEDYLSNRNGNHYLHPGTNFPRIITNYNFTISDNFEFFHPLPRNILKHLNWGRVFLPHLDFQKARNVQNECFICCREPNLWQFEQSKMSKDKIKTYLTSSEVPSNISVANSLFFLPYKGSCDMIKLKLKKNAKGHVPSSFGDYKTLEETQKVFINQKYEQNNKFTMKYLQRGTQPYCKDKSLLENQNLKQFSRGKNILLGKDVITCQCL